MPSLDACPICGHAYQIPCPSCHQSTTLDDVRGLTLCLSPGSGTAESDPADVLSGLVAWSADHAEVAVALDMVNVPHIGSRALAVMLRLNRIQKGSERRLRLLNAGPDLVQILRITRMDQLLDLETA